MLVCTFMECSFFRVWFWLQAPYPAFPGAAFLILVAPISAGNAAACFDVGLYLHSITSTLRCHSNRAVLHLPQVPRRLNQVPIRWLVVFERACHLTTVPLLRSLHSVAGQLLRRPGSREWHPWLFAGAEVLAPPPMGLRVAVRAPITTVTATLHRGPDTHRSPSSDRVKLPGVSSTRRASRYGAPNRQRPLQASWQSNFAASFRQWLHLLLQVQPALTPVLACISFLPYCPMIRGIGGKVRFSSISAQSGN